ncbi:hypothetical protein MMC25_007827 [Agyrium rufum]|nr:hypothetical protein [Agyrium rufum]
MPLKPRASLWPLLEPTFGVEIECVGRISSVRFQVLVAESRLVEKNHRLDRVVAIRCAMYRALVDAGIPVEKPISLAEDSTGEGEHGTSLQSPPTPEQSTSPLQPASPVTITSSRKGGEEKTNADESANDVRSEAAASQAEIDRLSPIRHTDSATASSFDPRYTEWRIENDCSIAASENHRLSSRIPGCIYLPFEFVTRVMNAHNEDDFAEIHKFFAAVESIGIKLLVNRTCGLHVHVGNKSGFRFGFIERLARFVISQEHNIAQVVQSEDRKDRDLRAARYAKPPSGIEGPVGEATDRFSSMLAACWKPVAEATYRMADYEFIIEQMNPDKDRYHAYNFQNVLQSPKDGGRPTGTIEFRQHHGTVEAQAIENWVRFLVRMCQWCNNVPEDMFLQMVLGCSYADDFTFLELLDFFCLPELKDFYSGRLSERVKPKEPLYFRTKSEQAKVHDVLNSGGNPDILQTLIFTDEADAEEKTIAASSGRSQSLESTEVSSDSEDKSKQNRLPPWDIMSEYEKFRATELDHLNPWDRHAKMSAWTREKTGIKIPALGTPFTPLNAEQRERFNKMLNKNTEAKYDAIASDKDYLSGPMVRPEAPMHITPIWERYLRTHGPPNCYENTLKEVQRKALGIPLKATPHNVRPNGWIPLPMNDLHFGRPLNIANPERFGAKGPIGDCDFHRIQPVPPPWEQQSQLAGSKEWKECMDQWVRRPAGGFVSHEPLFPNTRQLPIPSITVEDTFVAESEDNDSESTNSILSVATDDTNVRRAFREETQNYRRRVAQISARSSRSIPQPSAKATSSNPKQKGKGDQDSAPPAWWDRRIKTQPGSTSWLLDQAINDILGDKKYPLDSDGRPAYRLKKTQL